MHKNTKNSVNWHDPVSRRIHLGTISLLSFYTWSQIVLVQVSVEDVIDRQNRLAKMRSLLFKHEMKAKRIKKIKSKTYHKIMKKERQKVASAELEMNPEAAKQHAIKQELKRAEVISLSIHCSFCPMSGEIN